MRKLLNGISWLTQDSPQLESTKIQGAMNRVKYSGLDWDKERAEDPESHSAPDDGADKYL